MTSSSSKLIQGPWALSSQDDLMHLKGAVDRQNLLRELIDIGGIEHLDVGAVAEFIRELDDLAASKTIHPSDIKDSGLLQILRDISRQPHIWPFSIRRQAKTLQTTWEARFGRKFLGTPQRLQEDPNTGKNEDMSSHGYIGHGYHMSDQPKAHRLLNLQQPVASPSRQQGSEVLRGRQLVDLPRRGLNRSRPLSSIPIIGAAVDLQLPASALRAGALTFKMGDWWSGPVTAARDCIIEFKPADEWRWALKDDDWLKETPDDSRVSAKRIGASNMYEDKSTVKSGPAVFETARYEAASITYDEFGAYAILLSGDNEIPTDDPSTTIFTAHPEDPGKLAPVKNLRTKDAIRVLRTCHQTGVRVVKKLASGSCLRPAAGVRYDGLYRVTTYNVKLEEDGTWHLKYRLEKVPGQRSTHDILNLPSREMIIDAIEKKKEQEKEFDYENHDQYWGFTDELMKSMDKGNSKAAE